MRVSGGGLSVDAPPGWDVRIGRAGVTVAGARSNALLHAANFLLADGRGDFGSGVVSSMGSGHVFIVLFEYGRDSAGAPLFAQTGFPRALSPDWFSPNQLQRSLPGQAGLQRFFVEQGRPFSLYVVLGSYQNRGVLVQVANRLLGQLTVSRTGG